MDEKPLRFWKKTPGVTLVVIALVPTWMGYVYGGYYVADWGLAAFLMAALMLAASIAGVLGGARSWWSVAATSLLIIYAAWSFASIAWSPNKGDAWSGSSLTLLYLLVFWLSVTFVAMNASRRWALAALAIGPGIVSILTIPMLGSGREDFFLSNRLMGTVGYFNAQAAFLLVSFWVAMYVAGSRRIHPALRTAALATAVIGVEVAFLTQSRGAMVSLAASLPVFFLFSGQRLRGFLAFLPVVIALVISLPALNGVYLALADGGTAGAQISDATVTMILSGVGAGVYALIWSIVDLRWRPSNRLARVAGVLVLCCVALILVASSATFVQRVGNPVSWTQEKWTAFKTNDTTGKDDGRYFSASGSGRYTIWEVAGRDFTANPILGVGTYNFEATYYQQRDENTSWIRQPHSLPLEVLAERGIVGGVLFFGFLGVCVVAGLWRRFSSLNTEGKAQVGAMLAAITYWFVHSSAEWFWQMPAVTIPAIIYLAMLVAPWRHRRGDEEVFAPSDRPLRMAGIGLAVLTLVTVGPLYISDQIIKRADPNNPWTALGRVEEAQTFNPLDSSLVRREADLAVQIGDYPRATRAYGREISLNPEHYAPYTMLGGVYERLGQRERALKVYERAQALNPLDPELQQSIERVESER